MEAVVIENITLRVRDAERSTAFYEGVLGLEARDEAGAGRGST